MNIFDKQISIYNGVTDTIGAVVSLKTFLSSTKHKDDILLLRKTTDKEKRNAIKRRLPQATISGIFEPTRKAENLKQHSGFICVDIDKADNAEITNFDELKTQFLKLKNVAYCSKSVSGKGYFLIIPLAYPQLHKKQFAQIERDFLRYGIKIDHACSDVCRMRCISYDENPYINEAAQPYKWIYTEPPQQQRAYINTGNNEIDVIYNLCRKIEICHIDITDGYDNWMRIGAALASIGEQGREAYHICSRQNEKYNRTETDKKFNNLLKTISKIGIGTFINACKIAGVK